jgi:hypothetical protein
MLSPETLARMLLLQSRREVKVSPLSCLLHRGRRLDSARQPLSAMPSAINEIRRAEQSFARFEPCLPRPASEPPAVFQETPAQSAAARPSTCLGAIHALRYWPALKVIVRSWHQILRASLPAQPWRKLRLRQNTGIRSWISAANPFGSVMIIVQDFSRSPVARSFHSSQSPATIRSGDASRADKALSGRLST